MMESTLTAGKIAKSTAIIAASVGAVMLLLFDVTVDLRFALPGEELQVDAEQEALYDRCYAEKDAGIHQVAFGTIDNPDVQKEFISTNRAIARNECRSLYPRMTLQVKTPFAFNIVDLEARYW